MPSLFVICESGVSLGGFVTHCCHRCWISQWGGGLLGGILHEKIVPFLCFVVLMEVCDLSVYSLALGSEPQDSQPL